MGSGVIEQYLTIFKPMETWCGVTGEAEWKICKAWAVKGLEYQRKRNIFTLTEQGTTEGFLSWGSSLT